MPVEESVSGDVSTDADEIAEENADETGDPEVAGSSVGGGRSNERAADVGSSRRGGGADPSGAAEKEGDASAGLGSTVEPTEPGAAEFAAGDDGIGDPDHGGDEHISSAARSRDRGPDESTLPSKDSECGENSRTGGSNAVERVGEPASGYIFPADLSETGVSSPQNVAIGRGGRVEGRALTESGADETAGEEGSSTVAGSAVLRNESGVVRCSVDSDGGGSSDRVGDEPIAEEGRTASEGDSTAGESDEGGAADLEPIGQVEGRDGTSIEVAGSACPSFGAGGSDHTRVEDDAVAGRASASGSADREPVGPSGSSVRG
ncbi:hypothetical protein, partial [Nocardia alni]|uniref:hypothetical protein n=1 Tax=Nocardia alni TaxID=2815723 RepID=UPI0020B1F4AE